LVFLGFCLFILGYLARESKGEERLNLLILGEGGLGHTGADLSDTILFLSLGNKGSVSVSLPRDLWFEPWQTKVNSFYYFNKQQGKGNEDLKTVFGEILGKDPDRVIIVDFEVFRQVIDLIGGIDVSIDRTFDDFLYPIAGREDDLCDGDPEFRCRYEYLHFEAGWEHMDGERALKFVRSRNAQGDEGTDQARSHRQQKVIKSLKEKISSPSVFLSPRIIKGFWQIFNEKLRTDVSHDDLFLIAKIFFTEKGRNIESFVLDGWQEEKGLLYHPEKHSSGQWVLLPKDPTWQGVHQFIDCLFKEENKQLCSPN